MHASHGQRSLADYSPWDHKRVDTVAPKQHKTLPRGHSVLTFSLWVFVKKKKNQRQKKKKTKKTETDSDPEKKGIGYHRRQEEGKGQNRYRELRIQTSSHKISHRDICTARKFS